VSAPLRSRLVTQQQVATNAPASVFERQQWEQSHARVRVRVDTHIRWGKNVLRAPVQAQVFNDPPGRSVARSVNEQRGLCLRGVLRVADVCRERLPPLPLQMPMIVRTMLRRVVPGHLLLLLLHARPSCPVLFFSLSAFLLLRPPTLLAALAGSGLDRQAQWTSSRVQKTRECGRCAHATIVVAVLPFCWWSCCVHSCRDIGCCFRLFVVRVAALANRHRQARPDAM
jgi:hypothetical protein